MIINCSTNTSVQKNSNIAWAHARVWDEPILITETLEKYTTNSFELIVHNATVDDKGYYTCFSNDIYTVFKVVHVTAVECKHFTLTIKLHML